MPELGRPLISVVLLCHNQEKFVAEALGGVLAQTHSPIDIVVVDDCSSDATADVIEETLSRYPKRTDVRFIRNSHNATWWEHARSPCERHEAISSC